MKIKKYNFRALPVAILGGVGMSYLTFLAAFYFEAVGPAVQVAWLAGSWAGWWLVSEAWRNREVTIEYDDAGIRVHAPVGWDLPWDAVRGLRVADRLGDKFWVVEAEPGVQPSAPWGWFGNIFGAPPHSRVAPSGSAGLPKRPPGAGAAGRRVVSTSWRFGDPMLLVPLALLTALCTVGVVLGTSPAMRWFSFLGAIAAGLSLVFDVRPTRQSLIVDALGIRCLGSRVPWSLGWQQIASARLLAGVLLVTQPGEKDELSVEDEHRADPLAADDLVVRESPRQLRRRLLRTDGLHAAAVPSADADAIAEALADFQAQAWPLA